MSGIAEITTFSLRPDAGLQPIDVATAQLLAVPGCRRVFSGRTEADPLKLVVFVDWVDWDSHESFLQTPQFKPFLENLATVLAAPPAAQYVSLGPSTLTFLERDADAAKGKSIVELLSLYFPGDNSLTEEAQSQASDAAKQFLAATQSARGGGGDGAFGWTIEDTEHEGRKAKALAILTHWDSNEAHSEYQASDRHRTALQALKTIPTLTGISSTLVLL